jgi:capsular polysaccharide biosynthesis protein
VPVLIRSDIPQSCKDFLKALTTRELIEIDPTDFVLVEILYVLPGKSTVFDSRPPRGLSQAEFSPVVLSLFRNKVLECLAIGPDRDSKQRISFRRKSVTRNVVNWGKIGQELEFFSFEDIPLDSDFYSSQVQVFSNSNVVVSPGGAVLANIIFMNPGSKVVALTSFRGQRIDLWRKLSNSLDLKYIAVKGIPTYWGFRYLRKLHSNFYISPKKLRRILSREI